jgi:outer membrane protein OmpA-like peptidoglycan-associated protein
MLMPSAPVPDGSYNVIAKVENADGTAQTASAAAPVVIDTVAPKAPEIAAVAPDTAWPYAISGSWPEADAKSLSIELAGKTYELGASKELISDGKGKFTFVPTVDLAPGKYDLDMKVTDAANNVTSTVAKDAIIVVAPAPAAPAPIILVAPTVEKQVADNNHPVIKGTWGAGVAKGLTVSLAGTNYKLGAAPYALLADASGHWTLKPTKPLVNGVYDVIAEVNDGAGATLRDATVGELEVAIPAPPKAAEAATAPPLAEMKAPTVEVSISDSDHPTIKGTWAAGVAKSLVVSLDGTAHKLGKDFDLLSDASGNWTLKPKAPLVNGVYDVVVEENDGADRTAKDGTKDELTVKVAAPPPPPPAGQPYDCVSTIARISAVFPVRFEFNKDELKGPYELSANQYAALLKDSRCQTLKVQVEGHADYIGSEAYNQDLSERRAKNVIAALTKAGIESARLEAKGYSKDKPLDPATTATARMKNRRVEFTVIK